MPREIRLRSSARSDKGRVRKNNEDAVHLWAHDGYVLAVVADGMGGAVAGEEASRIAVETIRDEIQADHPQPDVYKDVAVTELATRLGNVVREANQNILHRVLRAPDLKGMGTTVTLAFARQQSVIVAHVGDSRAYVVDDEGAIRQVTADHSFVQALVDAGHISPEEAENHPMGNVLYRALGQNDDLEVDVLSDVRLGVGDRLVLCSDGLTLHVNADEIAETAIESDDPDTISEALVDKALSRGGRDNVSVIVIIVEELASEEDTQPAMQAISDDAEATTPIKPSGPPDIKRLHEQELDSAPLETDEVPSSQHGEGRDILEPHQ